MVRIMSTQEKSPPVFKEKRGIYYVAIAISIIFIAVFWWWRAAIYPYESSDDANIEGLDVSVSSIQPGQILKMAVDEGAVVQVGDLLFVLDDSLLRLDQQKALAGLTHAEDEASLQMIRRELAKEDFIRAKAEFKAGIIPEEAMSHAFKNLEMAEAQLQSILSLVEVQQAELASIELRLNLCAVTAKSSGVVAKRWHNAGDIIREGQTVLSMLDLSQLWVSANFEETKLALLRVGDSVNISVDAYPNKEFNGTVLVIGAAAASQFALIPPNNSSGNFTKVTQRVPLKISFKPPEKDGSLYLRPGMSVNVKIRAR
jgi:membrane fusion protein, multidrug efflux system